MERHDLSTRKRLRDGIWRAEMRSARTVRIPRESEGGRRRGARETRRMSRWVRELLTLAAAVGAGMVFWFAGLPQPRCLARRLSL